MRLLTTRTFLASVPTVLVATFAHRTGIELLHVPYKGGTPMVAAVLAGQVQGGFSGIPNVQQLIRAGKLKVLAISTARRSASMPDVPTLIELGIDGFDVATSIGLAAPAGIAHDVTARLQLAAARGLREPEVAARLQFIPLDQLAISPQCGFGSDVVGNRIGEDDQRRKLERVVEVARRIWGARSGTMAQSCDGTTDRPTPRSLRRVARRLRRA